MPFVTISKYFCIHIKSVILNFLKARFDFVIVSEMNQLIYRAIKRVEITMKYNSIISIKQIFIHIKTSNKVLTFWTQSGT